MRSGIGSTISLRAHPTHKPNRVVVEQLESRVLLSVSTAPQSPLVTSLISQSTATAAATPSPTQVVTIPDAALLAAVRAAFNKPTGDITVADMQTLTVLNADNTGIASMEGLQYATNLQDLEIGDNQISDVSPLANLSSLNRLFLFNNRISDVTPLSGLTNLTSLYLGSNLITNVQPLAGLSNLIVLYLVDDQVSDITPLAGMTQLSSLILGGNRLTDISTLANFKNLVYLELDRNNITDLSPIAGLTNLQELTLYGNQLSDISPLAGLVNMNSLSMQNNQITSLSAIAGFTHLTNLDVTNNNLDISANSPTMQIINTLIGRGASVLYNPQGGQTVTPPPATPPTPTGFDGVTNDWPRTITLNWSGDSLDANFVIKRSTDGINFTRLATLPANATAFTDTSVTPGQTYYYQIKATNSLGQSPLATSSAISLPGTPPAPTNVTATPNLAAGQITISWTDVSNMAISYVVRRSTDGVTYVRVARLPSNLTAFTDTGLSPGTTYFYKVKAANNFGQSALASAAPITFIAPPAPATNLLATPNTAVASIALSWTDSSGLATSYVIRRSTDGVNFIRLAVLPAGTTTYTDTALSTTTTYYYQIRILSPVGRSLSPTFWTPWV